MAKVVDALFENVVKPNGPGAAVLVARRDTREKQSVAMDGLPATLRAMLNDVQPGDPSAFATTAVAMLAVALLASAIPARAAGRVDPIVVLRDSMSKLRADRERHGQGIE